MPCRLCPSTCSPILESSRYLLWALLGPLLTGHKRTWVRSLQITPHRCPSIQNNNKTLCSQVGQEEAPPGMLHKRERGRKEWERGKGPWGATGAGEVDIRQKQSLDFKVEPLQRPHCLHFAAHLASSPEQHGKGSSADTFLEEPHG